MGILIDYFFSGSHLNTTQILNFSFFFIIMTQNIYSNLFFVLINHNTKENTNLTKFKIKAKTNDEFRFLR